MFEEIGPATRQRALDVLKHGWGLIGETPQAAPAQNGRYSWGCCRASEALSASGNWIPRWCDHASSDHSLYLRHFSRPHPSQFSDLVSVDIEWLNPCLRPI